ncbi:hypothetical protein BH10CHL1_BH10CHL1_32510 [soil metagenome]
MIFVDSLQVDNFRSLYQFQTDLRPFTVLIGRNDAGKTTIIKALQLLLNDDATQRNLVTSIRFACFSQPTICGLADRA